jgi:hypothetical protein
MTPDQKDYIRQNAASLDPQTMATHLGIRYYAVWEFCTRHGLPKVKSQVPKVRKVKKVKDKPKEGFFNVDMYGNWLTGCVGNTSSHRRQVRTQ